MRTEALGERNSVGLVLLLHPARAETQLEPPAADVIQRRAHLGEHRGDAVGVAQNTGSQANFFRHLREGAERRPGFEQGDGSGSDAFRFPRRIETGVFRIRARVERQEMIAKPYRIKTQPLRFLRHQFHVLEVSNGESTDGQGHDQTEFNTGVHPKPSSFPRRENKKSNGQITRFEFLVLFELSRPAIRRAGQSENLIA